MKQRIKDKDILMFRALLLILQFTQYLLMLFCLTATRGLHFLVFKYKSAVTFGTHRLSTLSFLTIQMSLIKLVEITLLD